MFDAFNDLAVLEPKCSGCGSKIEYDVTTRYDEQLQAHVCLKCNTPL